ncbi:hydrogenase formation protein HypD [Coprothermobacter platensis]|uniref:hydrogenase formation protein HypD n=1 Tax=Coprothermobacter platensis TaxID=108819 RepID=UPI0004773390|nr:hydrogenase formation protein HypD [Coprothermobacter platensis]
MTNRKFSSDNPAVLMEVCGTHTHELFRTGIRFSLPDWVRLISGPGCPVCVTDDRDLAKIITMARTYSVTVLTFGDMLRVPTPYGSLATLRSEGKNVQIVYSPVDALSYAREHQEEQCVFFAVGFETTMPAVAVAIQDTVNSRDVQNLYFLINHKKVIPALDILLSSKRVNVDGLILPGHVSAIIGKDVYEPLLYKHHIPGVVTGFSKDQLAFGLNLLMHLVLHGQVSVLNAYPEVVRDGGNKEAQNLIDMYFEPTDAYWRGLGFIPQSAMKLKEKFSSVDAEKAFPVDDVESQPIPGCKCADVVIGATEPINCPLFGKVCTPRNPIGPCMVSSEGTCSAWFRYGGEAVHG